MDGAPLTLARRARRATGSLATCETAKCAFATEYVAYLDHVISTTGVAMDEDKVEANTSWL
jgi:hypothetical protein